MIPVEVGARQGNLSSINLSYQISVHPTVEVQSCFKVEKKPDSTPNKVLL